MSSTPSSIAISVEACSIAGGAGDGFRPHRRKRLPRDGCPGRQLHWLATTLPVGSRPLFRLVALVVALPFGYRFERYTKSGVSEQVIAALAYRCLGTMALGLLDMAVGYLIAAIVERPEHRRRPSQRSRSATSREARGRRRGGSRGSSGKCRRGGPSGLLPHLEAARSGPRPRRSRRFTKRSRRSLPVPPLSGQRSTTSLLIAQGMPQMSQHISRANPSRQRPQTPLPRPPC